MANLIKLGGVGNQGTFEVVDTAGVVSVKLDGLAILAAQQAAIADASEAHALNATFSDTEAEAALDALGVKVNAIIAALEAHGLLAS